MGYCGCCAVLREFQKALGCKSSFFVDRVFLLFDENRDGFINFSEFACGIGILSPKGTFAMKVSCTCGRGPWDTRVAAWWLLDARGARGGAGQ